MISRVLFSVMMGSETKVVAVFALSLMVAAGSLLLSSFSLFSLKAVEVITVLLSFAMTGSKTEVVLAVFASLLANFTTAP